MASIQFTPEIQNIVSCSPSWCAGCELPKIACICNDDQPVRENSTVLKFMQSPNREGIGLKILDRAAVHMLKERDTPATAILIAASLNLKHGNPLALHIAIAEMSTRVLLDPATASGYDYDNQAWVAAGRYQRCSHSLSVNCGCFGRAHAGENVRA